MKLKNFRKAFKVSTFPKKFNRNSFIKTKITEPKLLSYLEIINKTRLSV